MVLHPNKNCYKIRISIESKGKGKSGGGRVITCVIFKQLKVYLLTIYDKSEQDDISDSDLDDLLKFISNSKQDWLHNGDISQNLKQIKTDLLHPLLNKLNDVVKLEIPLVQKIWIFVNKSEDIYCDCGKLKKWKSFKDGWRVTCGEDECIKNHRNTITVYHKK